MVKRRFALLAPVLLAPVLLAAEPKKDSEFMRTAALYVRKCSGCHTIGRGDRVGPDLKGVLERRSRDWLSGFIARPSAYLDSDPTAKELVRKFNGVRMADLGLTPSQVADILSYIEAAGKGPAGGEEAFVPLEEEPFRAKLRHPEEGFAPSRPGLAVLAALLLLSALSWRRGAAALTAALLVGAAGAGYWSLGGRRHHRLLGNQQGYAPVQPIAFSHLQHAGELGISCFYCHHGSEKSPAAGVPSVNVCMNCHRVVQAAKGQDRPSPELARIKEAWEARRPLEWLRVHDLPDFVRFSHKEHVRNDIQCQECHGPVETMPRLRQASNLSMGWCVNCHRKGPGQAPTHWKRSGGPLDCAACHW